MWETPLSWYAKCSLPLAVRVSKTCVLKFPTDNPRRRSTNSKDFHPVVWQVIFFLQVFYLFIYLFIICLPFVLAEAQLKSPKGSALKKNQSPNESEQQRFVDSEGLLCLLFPETSNLQRNSRQITLLHHNFFAREIH